MPSFATQRSTAGAVPAGVTGASSPVDSRREQLLARLQLTAERTLSDDGDSFSTLVCRDAEGRRVVLKYIHRDSPDAFRRLTNESRLLAMLPSMPPLRLLSPRAAERGHLVTEFDPGVLLRGATMDDDHVITVVADALARFHAIEDDFGARGIVARERVSTYYLKVLGKHLLHLWPAVLSASEAARCVALLTAAMPAIVGTAAPCHGDLMPTNLLFDPAEHTVTFTDFEAFMSANHPLFDVLSLCTVTDRPLSEWRWQTKFIQRYLREGRGPRLVPESHRFRTAYRGILIFFLVYRLNETRLLAASQTYFDGIGKSEYLRAKARRLATQRSEWRTEPLRHETAVQADNLRRILNRRHFRDHLDAVLSNGA